MNEQQISLGEFVKQLTCKVSGKDSPMPLKDERPWHTLFYRLKKDTTPGKPAFFESLQFDWVGPYPICSDLSDYIHALHFTGCMSAGNPTYDEMTLNKELADKWSGETLTGELPKFMDHTIQLAQEEFKA